MSFSRHGYEDSYRFSPDGCYPGCKVCVWPRYHDSSPVGCYPRVKWCAIDLDMTMTMTLTYDI